MLEPGLGLPWHDGNAGRSQVQADGVRAYGVLGLVMGQACEHQLYEVALPLAVGALCAWARGAASDQADVLDLVRQAMADHRVVPVDQGRELVVVPQQIPRPSSLVLSLQHKAHARIVALVLEAGKSAAPALEAHAAGLAHAHAVEGAVGATRERLGQHRIQVLG